MKKTKIAFVIQRYGLDISGGAELHCRYICENLMKDYDITVLTTCARDYITWENEYRAGKENINGVKVVRFKVKKKRNPVKFGRVSNRIFNSNHDLNDELEWLDAQGPYSTSLIKFINKNRENFDIFIFFSYRYYHSYWGVKAVKDRAFLVPTAEEDPAIKLGIFKEIFNDVQAIIYNSHEEKEMIENLHSNFNVSSDIVGVGIRQTEETDWQTVKEKFKLNGDYIIYIGRIDNNKGCYELFRYFNYYQKKYPETLKLVLAGKNVIDLPSDEAIQHVGFVSDSEKMILLENAVALVMPSKYESLSMVLLEAW